MYAKTSFLSQYLLRRARCFATTQAEVIITRSLIARRFGLEQSGRGAAEVHSFITLIEHPKRR